MIIELAQDTIDNKDIDLLIEWLKTYPRLTKGSKTIEFEEKWSRWLGCKHSVFVNSGSSANLLMIYALKYLKMLKNKKICVPSLAWATDLAPIIQFDLEPLLIDCNKKNLSVDLKHLEDTFIEEEPAAMILVSILGLSPDMDAIRELCNKYDVILIEDNCESQGTSYKNIKLGNFGLMSSFSTYFGHTMSTIEGGMICTNDTKLYKTLLQLRSHGWDRDLPKEDQEKLGKEWGGDEFSSLYTFYVPGFNLRSTDLQAFIGIGQLDNIDSNIIKRNLNFRKFRRHLDNKVWFPNETEYSYTASFAIPVIMKTIEARNNLIKDLKVNDIACRPLVSGSMGNQPFYKKIYGKKELPVCSEIDAKGIYVPNHPMLSDDDIDLICSIILKNK